MWHKKDYLEKIGVLQREAYLSVFFTEIQPFVRSRESSNTGSGNEMRERDPCSPRGCISVKIRTNTGGW